MDHIKRGQKVRKSVKDATVSSEQGKEQTILNTK